MKQKGESHNKINLHFCDQLLYNKGGKSVQWWRDSLFTERCGENWTATCKSMKVLVNNHPRFTARESQSCKEEEEKKLEKEKW